MGYFIYRGQIKIIMYRFPTPTADKILQIYTFRTKEGIIFNDVITYGQKLIMEVILNRGISYEQKLYTRIHLMAMTRYGKSLAVAAGVCVRASAKGEPWAIVAPTKEQSLIIMDYVVQFSVNDPIISSLLKVNAQTLNNERLTQRRSRNHITYIKGGEVRVFSADQTMGFGSKNVIEDEAGLITNKQDSKIFRMLGDNAQDSFFVKIGNPWDSTDQETGEEHHFYSSFQDENYFTVDINVDYAISEGRITEEFKAEVSKKPNFSVLYENIFPDRTRKDAQGFMPLLTHAFIKRAMVKPGTVESVGNKKLGIDPADGGENESVIADRSMNLARIVLKTTSLNNIELAAEVPKFGQNIEDWFFDKQGVGAGTVRTLQANAMYYRKINAINTGLPLPDEIKDPDAHAQFLNLRAYICWQLKMWVEQGGKIEESDGFEKQLAAVKYKNAGNGKVVIISKDELRKRGIDDLGQFDAISLTFAPKTKKVVIANQKVVGGVKPYYPNVGW